MGKGLFAGRGLVNSAFRISISGTVGQYPCFYSAAHDWTPHEGLSLEPLLSSLKEAMFSVPLVSGW